MKYHMKSSLVKKIVGNGTKNRRFSTGIGARRINRSINRSINNSINKSISKSIKESQQGYDGYNCQIKFFKSQEPSYKKVIGDKTY
jgi:hypothetical protein